MTALTTLIPAYTKTYLAETFMGLRNQTFKDFKVILSDDSPNAEITGLLRDGHFARLTDKLDITVVRGPQNTRRNHEQLLGLWGDATPLVHFHLDDDFIYPEFYQRHVQAHMNGPYGVTVSRRWFASADGRPIWPAPLPEGIADHPERRIDVDRAMLVTSTIVHCDNWFGELSNMVFSSEGAACYPMPPAAGLSYYALLDIGFVLELTQHHRLGYLHEYLSVFRQHGQQTTNQVNTHGGRLVSLAWVTYALNAWRHGELTAQQAVQAVSLATQRAIQRHGDDPVMAEFYTLLQHNGSSLDALHTAYSRFWNTLLASQPGTRHAGLVGAGVASDTAACAA